jgi:hypothetical protein
MSYELVNTIEFATGVYVIGVFISLVLCNVHELKTHEANHYKTSQAILWPISLIILFLIVVWSFIEFQAERLATFIVSQLPTETEAQQKQKTHTKTIRPVKVDVPQQPTDIDEVYSNIEYVVKSQGGWYTVKIDGHDDELKVRLTKSYKAGEDKFADALVRWVTNKRDVIQAM